MQVLETVPVPTKYLQIENISFKIQPLTRRD